MAINAPQGVPAWKLSNVLLWTGSAAKPISATFIFAALPEHQSPIILLSESFYHQAAKSENVGFSPAVT